MENNLISTMGLLMKKFQLGNSLFRGRWKMTKEMANNSNIPEAEIKAIATREMVMQLSDKIMKELPTAITEEQKGEYIEFGVEVLVVKMQDFKYIVEAAISELNDMQIMRIRNGDSVL